jgi:hypothetical protein
MTEHPYDIEITRVLDPTFGAAVGPSVITCPRAPASSAPGV